MSKRANFSASPQKQIYMTTSIQGRSVIVMNLHLMFLYYSALRYDSFNDCPIYLKYYTFHLESSSLNLLEVSLITVM